MFTSTNEAPVLLIGAAHVVDLRAPLRQLLASRVLDGIAVELDADRAAHLLRDGPTTESPGEAPLFLRIWALVQRRLGTEIGGDAPGAEMRTAAEVAKAGNLPLFLIDDPIRETLGRLLRSMSFKERVLLMTGGIVGLFLPSRVVEQQLDQYAEAPQPYLAELRHAYPTVARVLLDERNEHMANRLAVLRQRGYGRLAVVVGDAHLLGLQEALHRRGVPVETVPFSQLRSTTGP